MIYRVSNSLRTQAAMELTVTDADLTAMSTALAVFFVGQLELQLSPVVKRLEEAQRRSGIEPIAFDVQSRSPSASSRSAYAPRW